MIVYTTTAAAARLISICQLARHLYRRLGYVWARDKLAPVWRVNIVFGEETANPLICADDSLECFASVVGVLICSMIPSP